MPTGEERSSSLYVLSGIDGYIGRQVAGQPLIVATQIEIHGGGILWKEERDESGSLIGRLRRSNRGALDDLLPLARSCKAVAAGEDVLAFARKWGTLQVCEHGIPFTHEPECLPFNDEGSVYEPISGWCRFALAAESLLSSAAALRRRPHDQETDTERKHLVSRLNRMLRITEVAIFCRDRGGQNWPAGLEIEVTSRGSLLGVLGIQILLACTSTEFLFTCASCGKPFNPAPSDRPRTGHRAFCSDCGRSAATRFAARDYRARKREEKKGEKTGTK